MAADNKKFYFNNSVERLSAEELSDILWNLLAEKGFGIMDEGLGGLKETILAAHEERCFEKGETKAYYPIYEISVREIGYCTAIAKYIVDGEIITTY